MTLKNPRLQDLSKKRLPQEMIESAGLSKRLKENDQQDTMGSLGSR